MLKTALGLQAHGERGNALTEFTRYLRPSWWQNHFEENNWRVLEVFPVGIFYTGYGLAGTRLPLAVRKQLARVLGSSTWGFLLQSK